MQLLPTIIALIGLSGSGKSSVSRALATHLGWPLHDIDQLIEQAAARPIPAIFATVGEAGFRDIETSVLQTAIAEPPAVIATGAGIVVRETNRAMLAHQAYVVWLDAPTPRLLERLRAHDEVRPLLAGDDPAGRLEAQRQARSAWYAEIALVRFDPSHATIDELCTRIVEALRQRPHASHRPE